MTHSAAKEMQRNGKRNFFLSFFFSFSLSFSKLESDRDNRLTAKGQIYPLCRRKNYI